MVSQMNHLQVMLLLLWAILATVGSQVLGPNCQEFCGNVSIPYPFGTTNGGYYNSDFLITCDNSSSPPVPYLRLSNFEVIDISLDGELRVLTLVAADCYDKQGNPSMGYATSVTLHRFPFSYKRNKLMAVGCDTNAFIQDSGEKYFMTGCMSLCADIDSVTDGVCSGIGCCQTQIPRGVLKFNLSVSSYFNHTYVWGFNPCSYIFIVEEKAYHFSIADLGNFQNKTNVPTVLDWAIGNVTCEEAKKNMTAYACKAKSTCNNTDNGLGYRCYCDPGYEGYAYLPNGCQDIDECKDPSLHNCTDSCVNTIGSYSCPCPNGFYGDGRKNGQGCKDVDECENSSLNNCTKECVNIAGSYKCACPKGYSGDGRKDGDGCTLDRLLAIKVSVGIGMGLIVLIVGSGWLYWGLKNRRLIKLKERFFQQNGGLLLQQQLSQREVPTNATKIFSAAELKNATNNYNEDRIIGLGGYGTVYKGIFPDNSVVAIKKSKIVDRSQIEQFINEVFVLSQINHRNVVKLLGCCLETEVPLLVYEFITNGTLFEHIHNNEKTSHNLSWDTRLRIASETAGVLSYLHSATSTPIIHRDVKSTNILLDENYTSKVSDFGASRLVPLDEAQISTMVQGTLGYLDPEYLHTSQLTDKSDVYSFGVVLVELLTGKKALCFDRPEEERSLAMYFLSSLKGDRLFEIIEESIVNDGNTHEQVKKVASLAMRCLRVKGEERPCMKEVAMELEGLMRVMVKHTWVNVGLDYEETEYLLGEQSMNSRYNDADNTSGGYDSITDQVPISVGGGR